MRDRIIASEPLGTTTDGWTQKLVTKVYYDEGGANVWTYEQKQRGYYVSVAVETTKSERGMSVRRFGVFDGLNVGALIEPASRFNARRLASVAPDAGTVARIRAQVMERFAARKAS